MKVSWTRPSTSQGHLAPRRAGTPLSSRTRRYQRVKLHSSTLTQQQSLCVQEKACPWPSLYHLSHRPLLLPPLLMSSHSQSTASYPKLPLTLSPSCSPFCALLLSKDKKTFKRGHLQWCGSLLEFSGH